MNPKEFLKTKGITKATIYTDNRTLYIDDLAKAMQEFKDQENTELRSELEAAKKDRDFYKEALVKNCQP